MELDQYRYLLREALAAGPEDGKFLLQHAQSNSEWEALYLASRDSTYAAAWRRMFGENILSQTYPRSILELAIMLLLKEADSSQSSLILPESMFMIRLIANCCIDNTPNKITVVRSRGLIALMKLLVNGVDPNVLVPTIYNICVDFEDVSEEENSQLTDSDRSAKVTLAEEQLARIDLSSQSLFSGLLVLLSPQIVRSCAFATQGYLSELIEMSSRLCIDNQTIPYTTDPHQIEHVIERLLAEDGGGLLAGHSALSRISIIRSLLAVSTSDFAKTYLASSGAILHFALAADCSLTNDDYLGEDAEERKENAEALESLQTLMLKLAYEICQAPQFIEPPKYGVARQSMNIVSNAYGQSYFAQAIAYIVLYGFIDGDPRAHTLATEGLLSSVSTTLTTVDNKTLIHPALGVAIKLAVTWSLRSQLWSYKAMQAVQRFLVGRNLGYEIPLSAVTFLRLMIKGHPDHIVTLTTQGWNSSMMEDAFNLFSVGQDAICLEVGLLVIEICATLGQHNYSDSDTSRFNLDSISGKFRPEQWSSVLVYMATKAHAVNPTVAQRVWLALGLLSRIPNGQRIIQLALQDPSFVQRVQEVKAQQQPGLTENIEFMLYHIGESSTAADLEAAMDQMSLN